MDYSNNYLRKLAPARIVTWNCQKGIIKAWPTVESFDADVVIIQEVGSETEEFVSKRGWSAAWTSAPSTPTKGLAVLARPGLHLIHLDQLYPWSLPVRIEGPVSLSVLGFWAMTRTSVIPGYREQAILSLTEIDTLASPRIVAGDFNAWDQPRHLEFVQTLETMGLISAYQKFNNVTKGHEADPTYFHRSKVEQPFHCDFMFVPDSNKLIGVDVGSFESFPGSRVSDHVPVIVDILLR
jgi:exodeoxyribonuclease-3